MKYCPERQPPSAFNANHFCLEAQPTRLLAVVGIFSVDAHVAARAAIRSSWMHSSSGILARFVMGGYGVAAPTLRESAATGDIVFVREDPNVPRSRLRAPALHAEPTPA